MFSSPYLDWTIERIALNAKVVGGPHGDKDKMVAAASESSIILWSIQDGGSGNEIGKLCLCVLSAPSSLPISDSTFNSDLSPPPQACSVSVCLWTISSLLATSWWLQAIQGRLGCGMQSRSTGRWEDGVFIKLKSEQEMFLCCVQILCAVI